MWCGTSSSKIACIEEELLRLQPACAAHQFDLSHGISCAFPNYPLMIGGDHANRRQMP
jgi:hypothetical protein